tara:strand:+ start:48 stop:593 length:546 start_codon:yes stop_codon:yes gene_type:complete
MEFTIKEAIKEKEDLIKNSRGARSFAPFVKKAKEQIEQWKKTGTYPEFVSERKTREKEEKQRIRDIDKTTADEVGARVSKAAKKYKPKPKPEKVKAKKAKISKVEPSVLGSEEAGKEWFKKYLPEMDRKELYTYPTDPEDNGGDKTIKQEFGKHGGKVVKRRGGGKALRGFGRATYSDKLY